MKQDSIKETKQLMVCKGDLVIKLVNIPLWFSLFKKIIFRHVIHVDQTHGLVFLKTDQGAIHAFRFSDKQFFSINEQMMPAYDSDDVSWLDMNVNITTSMQPIKQSSMDWYFGAYLLTLKTWVTCLKKRLARVVLGS